MCSGPVLAGRFPWRPRPLLAGTRVCPVEELDTCRGPPGTGDRGRGSAMPRLAAVPEAGGPDGSSTCDCGSLGPGGYPAVPTWSGY
jgi:hypothetical protein